MRVNLEFLVLTGSSWAQQLKSSPSTVNIVNAVVLFSSFRVEPLDLYLLHYFYGTVPAPHLT